MNSSELKIRLANAIDASAINEIYNYYVLNSTATYQEQPTTIEERTQWLAAHGERFPVTVAELSGDIIGWGSLSAFHPRSAYRLTVENAVYVRHDLQRKGIGRAILMNLIARARAIGHHSVIALIDSTQAGSIALHATSGFRKVGRISEAGLKFERWLDVVYMQLML